nr:MAG TPA: hypothetical protein [Caudoviricetes sp.]
MLIIYITLPVKVDFVSVIYIGIKIPFHARRMRLDIAKST